MSSSPAATPARVIDSACHLRTAERRTPGFTGLLREWVDEVDMKRHEFGIPMPVAVGRIQLSWRRLFHCSGAGPRFVLPECNPVRMQSNPEAIQFCCALLLNPWLAVRAAPGMPNALAASIPGQQAV